MSSSLNKSWRPLELIALIAILLLAAALRLGSPGVVEFKRDEANLSYLALDFARAHVFPLLGISSSVGVPNPPISVYIFAIPYLLTSDPTVATQFVGLLNVLAVLLTYLLARRYYGVGVALLAALLYAVSPWGVIYSRKIWAQDLLPPFLLATILTGLMGLIDGKRWAQWLCLPLFAITVQIHYSALVLVLPVAYLIWRGRPNLTRAFSLSVIPAILITLPFVLGLITADLPTVEELSSFVASGEGSSDSRSLTLTGTMLQYAALTIAGTEIHSLAGPQAYSSYLAAVPDAYPLFGLLAWGVLFAALWLLYRIWRCRDSRVPIDTLLLLWLVTPIAVFSVTWTALYPHYLIVMLPAAFMVIAVGLGDLWRDLSGRLTLRRFLFAGVGVVLAVIVTLQIVLWLALVEFLRVNDTPGGFGTPLENLLPIRNAILSQNTSQVISRLDGQFVGTNDDATVWNFLLYDLPDVRFVDENTWVYPAQPYVWFTSTCDWESNIRPSRSRFPCYQYETLPGGLGLPDDDHLLHTDSVFANGVSLIAYQWLADTRQCLDLYWSINVPADQDYTFSIHFFDDTGAEIVNADGLSWRGVYWRPGDTVLRRFCLSGEQAALVDQIVGVNIGMYTYDGLNFHNLDVLDSSGTPIDQTIPVHFP